MIEIQITNEMKSYAEKKINLIKFNSNKNLNKFGSEKNRTMTGYLGEQIVMAYLKTAINVDDYEYDLLYNNIKIEVKTISCKFKPKLDYLCTVNSCNDVGTHRQSANYYIFTRIINDLSVGWILGYMKCSEFFEKGKYITKCSEAVAGISFDKANATVLPISELNLMKGDNAQWVKDYETTEKINENIRTPALR